MSTIQNIKNYDFDLKRKLKLYNVQRVCTVYSMIRFTARRKFVKLMNKFSEKKIHLKYIHIPPLHS